MRTTIMSDPLPIEYATARVTKFPGGGIKIYQDKIGREYSIDRHVHVKFQTRAHIQASYNGDSEEVELPEECMMDGGCPCRKLPGMSQVWLTGTDGKKAKFTAPDGGLREVEIDILINARMYTECLEGTWNLTPNNFRILLPVPEDFRLSFHKEIFRVAQTLGPEIEAERARLEKLRVKRTTGVGAERRIAKMKERLQLGLKNIHGNLEAEAVLQIILLHMEFDCFLVNQNGSNSNGFTIYISEPILESFNRPGSLPVAELLRQAVLWRKGAGAAMGEFLSYTRKNPESVELLKLDHVQEAVDLASIASMLER